jgi:cellulose synthase/poly-beta-1,6-N-acetylglucosamine synthase-like glycosyltransferase
MARVTAYIPVYNGAEFVGPNIEGLLSQTHPFDEILVIDDGSTDATAEIASGYKGVTVIRHAKNKGVAGGRNTALAAARNELVAAFDADCVAHPAWLASLLPHLDDPKVVGAGGRLIEGIQRTVADRWRRARMAQEWGPSFIRNPTFLYGCNSLFRKSAIIEIGGYNESMRTCGEDPDICARLRKRGWDFVYDPAAQATCVRCSAMRCLSIFDTTSCRQRPWTSAPVTSICSLWISLRWATFLTAISGFGWLLERPLPPSDPEGASCRSLTLAKSPQRL